jgi:hypothetical protein
MTHREEVVGRLGAPSVEDGFEDLPELEKQFGSAQTTEKTRDLRQQLQQQERVMIYSRSNSIMFLYLDAKGRASHASCFLQ